jgi:hypothetical protein
MLVSVEHQVRDIVDGVLTILIKTADGNVVGTEGNKRGKFDEIFLDGL